MTARKRRQPFVPPVIDRRKPPVDEKRIPIFYIIDEEGNETEYTAPERVPAGHAIIALAKAASSGYVAAAGWMVNEALGEKAINALYAAPQLTQEDAHNIMQQLSALYFGQAEELAIGEQDGTDPEQEGPGN